RISERQVVALVVDGGTRRDEDVAEVALKSRHTREVHVALLQLHEFADSVRGRMQPRSIGILAELRGDRAGRVKLEWIPTERCLIARRVQVVDALDPSPVTRLDVLASCVREQVLAQVARIDDAESASWGGDEHVAAEELQEPALPAA